MTTEKLFYSDSHQRVFSATVISCVPSGNGNTWEAVLDRTAFFPEGGGQAADTGTLGGVQVLDVHEKDGVIYHKIKSELEAGKQVSGEINWEKRFERMQQHTGEHIVSGIIHGHFGYDNVGFHLGEEVCTLDLNGPMTKEELHEVEKEANEVVYACLPVETSFPSRAELERMDYRSKIEIEGSVRIVTVPGVDVCACCAPHVKNTGQIGLIKFISSQNYKGGIRITMVCGRRAREDYQKKENLIKAIMYSLSAKEEKTAEAVEQMKEAQNHLKVKCAQLQSRVLEFEAMKVREGEPLSLFFAEDLDGNAARELMNKVLDRRCEISAVFTEVEKNQYRYVIGSRSVDLREFCKTMNAAFSGRGGGKPEMVQGTVQGRRDEIEAFVEKGLK